MCIKLAHFVSALLIVFVVLSCTKDLNPDEPTISNITITEIRPTHGPFGTTDTIIGKGFDRFPMPDSVLLNGRKLTIISKTDEEVIVQIPELTGSGTLNIWYNGKVYKSPVFTYDSTLWVTTLAGSPTEAGYADGPGLSARFKRPNGIAADQSGNVYVADDGNHIIRKITPQGIVTTFAGQVSAGGGYANGQGAAAKFQVPQGLAIDNKGFLYVADMFNYMIRKISPVGEVTTLAGLEFNFSPPESFTDGNSSVARFNQPIGVAVDKNYMVYVADMQNKKIRKISPEGNVSSLAGGDYYNFGVEDGKGSEARFFKPRSIAVDPFGTVFVVDTRQRMRKITPEGVVTTILGPIEPAITGPFDLFDATAIATDKLGNVFFSIPVGIIKMTPEGKIIRYATGGIGELDGPAQTASYRSINGIAIDDSGTLYITDNNRVRKIFWK